MSYPEAPVPVDPAQWPEARGFGRLYSRNPEYQARFVMALFGFRQALLEATHDREAVQAIEITIRTFHERYPEFMQDGFVPEGDIGGEIYHVDDRLKSYMLDLEND